MPLKEALDILDKVDTRPLLTAFGGLSLCEVLTSWASFSDPLSSGQMLLLGGCVVVAFALVWIWIKLVMDMNVKLREGDIVSWGPMLGAILLAGCVRIAFSYLSSHPQGLTFALLGEPNFIYFCTLFLLAAQTLKIRRYRE
jgi:hypothetical protein